jgi:hypothetical protein
VQLETECETIAPLIPHIVRAEVKVEAKAIIAATQLPVHIGMLVSTKWNSVLNLPYVFITV